MITLKSENKIVYTREQIEEILNIIDNLSISGIRNNFALSNIITILQTGISGQQQQKEV